MDYKTDEEKMKVALDQANLAFNKNEVPVGAAIFDASNNLICANHNRRELDNNPTAHAEILVLQEAAQILGSWRLENTTLAVTLEPDAMCAGAIVIARVKKLLYGAPNSEYGWGLQKLILFGIGTNSSLLSTIGILCQGFKKFIYICNFYNYIYMNKFKK